MNADLYRAFWRWHFYAGLIALPFLAWLAVTGGLYLFKPEIERIVYARALQVDGQKPSLPVSQIVANAQGTVGGTVTQVDVPQATTESWRLRIETKAGVKTAFVDPSTGAVKGVVSEGGVMQTIHDLHSLALTGPVGNALIEMAAGWAIVLIVTGIMLWWPSGGAPILALRAKPTQRLFWRDLHASVGILGGAIALFLAMTGMPWSVFWGKQVQRVIAESGYGRPPAPGLQPWERHKAAASGAATARQKSLPWALQEASMPHARHRADVGIDAIVRLSRNLGIGRAVSISIPQNPGEPYSVSRVAHRAQDARVIYVEPETGNVLQDVGHRQFGTGAKIVEWGIATHQGKQYGPANRWVMLAGCIALLLMCITAPVLWWKRRVNGGLARPPEAAVTGNRELAATVAALLGLLFPLTGATMVLAHFVDALLVRRSARRS